MTPTILALRIEIEPMAGMFHRGNFVSGTDELGNDALDKSGLAAVGTPDK